MLQLLILLTGVIFIMSSPIHKEHKCFELEWGGQGERINQVQYGEEQNPE
jgi:hypothetical protein